MRNRIVSLLVATITATILAAAVPARASSDLNVDLLFHDSFRINDQRRIEQQEVPRSLSFKFASLYNRILDTAARIAEFTNLDRTTMNSLGLGISFQSFDPLADPLQPDLDTTRRLLPDINDEGPYDGFSLRIDMSDDHAPLVDPSPRKPSDPIKDKIWISLGARYHHSERLSLDVGYEHLWVNETTFDRPGGIGSDIMGDYRSELDLIGARLRWAFD